MELTSKRLDGRCPRCLVRQEVCFCDRIPTVRTKTRLLVVRHVLEALRSSNTARYAALAMPTCTLVDYGERGAPFDASLLRAPGSWLLYPSHEPCTAPPTDLKTLVVLDGSWSQTRRMAQRIPELRTMPRLSLPSPPPKTGLPALRKQHLDTGMSTLEAVAQAIALLEGEEVARPLFDLHRVHVERSLALRYPVPKERREEVYPSLKPRSVG